MLDRFERQVILAALGDLESRVGPGLKDPAAQAALGMVNRLLAHITVRNPDARQADADHEVKALAAEETAEDAVLADARRAATEGSLSVDALTSYLRARLEDPRIEITQVNASLGGFSKQTFIVGLNHAAQLDNALVIRRDQAGGPVESLAADEQPIVALMHRHGVPVAEPLWADHETPFGGSVMVTRRAAGTSAFDLTASALGAESRKAASALARVLAQIHRVPVQEVDWLGTAADASVQQHVTRLVAGFEQQWQRRRVSESPLIAAAFAYLKANVPARSPGPVIVHGDASLRNLLLQDGQASAMLDWELWHIGDPTEDLAYCRPDVEQIMPWQDFISEYKAHGGQDYDERIGAYYGLFGSLRNAVFGQSMLHGFPDSPRPEMRMAFAPVYLARKLMPDIARRLAELNQA